MKTLTLKTSGDPFWDRITALVNGETATVSGSFTTDGATYYNAVFPAYGEVTHIPASACDVVDAPDPQQ